MQAQENKLSNLQLRAVDRAIYVPAIRYFYGPHIVLLTQRICSLVACYGLCHILSLLIETPESLIESGLSATSRYYVAAYALYYTIVGCYILIVAVMMGILLLEAWAGSRAYELVHDRFIVGLATRLLWVARRIRRSRFGANESEKVPLLG